MKYIKEECPFCHSANVVVKHWGRKDLKFANCRDCMACGPAKPTAAEAVKAWNMAKRRADAVQDSKHFEGDLDTFECLECGWHGIVDDMTRMRTEVGHCPGCGAEVNPPRLF